MDINDDGKDDSIAILQSHILDLIRLVELWIINALRDERTCFKDFSYQDILVLIMTNLLTNLTATMPEHGLAQDRIKFLEHTNKRIAKTSKTMWEMLEASRADDSVRN